MKNFTLFFFYLVSGCAHAQVDTLKLVVHEGIELHGKREYSAAIRMYKSALAIDPESALVHYEIAYSYSGLKMYDSAIWHCEKVISAPVKSLALHGMILKGSAIDDKGDTKGAVEFYRNALLLYPDDYLLLYNYAVSCERIALMNEAEIALERALSNRVSHPGSNLKLAYLKKNKGEKVSVIMGLYFFLLLENDTERSRQALRELVVLLYGDARIDTVTTDDRGNRKVSINIVVESNKDVRAMSAEIGVAAITSASMEINKNKPFDERFIFDTEKIFGVLGSIMHDQDRKSRKKKSKKANHEISDLLWDVYVPYFASLKEAGHAAAFCYHILNASEDEQLRTLIDFNKEKLEHFYLWANNN